MEQNDTREGKLSNHSHGHILGFAVVNNGEVDLMLRMQNKQCKRRKLCHARSKNQVIILQNM